MPWRAKVFLELETQSTNPRQSFKNALALFKQRILVADVLIEPEWEWFEEVKEEEISELVPSEDS